MSNVASLRQIRRRIRSVENTQKITRAMEMVAAAKLRRFQDFLESARPYTERLGGLLDRLLAEVPAGYKHPFLERAVSFLGTPSKSAGFNESKLSEPGTFGRGTLHIVFTSDTGLCGTYNSALEDWVKTWLSQNSDQESCFLFVGKHGANAFQKKTNRVLATFSDLRVSRVDEILEGLRQAVEKAFMNSEVQEVYALYTRMESLARYEPTVEKILPITPSPRANRSGRLDRAAIRRLSKPPFPLPLKGERVKGEGVSNKIPPLVEPDSKVVLDKLVPAFFEARLRFIFYHALLTEQIARMSAMRQATQNAEEMIDELTLARNKARQAAITKEIIEIVSGSRALKLK